MGLVGKEKNLKLPEMIARICTPDRFATEVVSVWPGYVPGLVVPRVNKPRGLRLPPAPDLESARQAIQLIEVTLAVPGTARG
jgi:hypothetical protein